MGVWSTGEACKKLNRQFIWIEMDEKYFEASKKRLWINSNLINLEEHLLNKINHIKMFTINNIKKLKIELNILA